MSNQTDKIANDIRDCLDVRVKGLSKVDYLDVLENVVSLFEGYIDCVKHEMEKEEQP